VLERLEKPCSTGQLSPDSFYDYSYVSLSEKYPDLFSPPSCKYACIDLYKTVEFVHVVSGKTTVFINVERVKKLQEHTKVELNELLAANFDRTDSRVSFLDKKLRFLGDVTRELLGNNSHEDFLKRFFNAGIEIRTYVTWSEFQHYFGNDPEPMIIEPLSRFAYKVAYISKGASRRYSLKLYKRDLRRIARQVFTETFKKHSNILGEDDGRTNNCNSYFSFSNQLNHHYVTGQKTDNRRFRSDH
jgi:hypothetical protein